jgi:hypothetical protein
MAKFTIKPLQRVDADYDFETGTFTPAHDEPLKLPELSPEQKAQFLEALKKAAEAEAQNTTWQERIQAASHRRREWWLKNMKRD